MIREVEGLVDLYEGGSISRRQLLQGLVALGIGTRVSPTRLAPTESTQGAPVFQTRTINHVTLYVSDVARSKSFYQSLTGLPIRGEDATFCEFKLENSFLGLYSADSARPGFDHFCFGIDRYEPRAALSKLKAAFPNAQPTLENDEQVYLRDPDGVRVQFADVNYKR